VGTTSKFTGVATFGSTISNGTYTYTLPSATGTLALTSAIPTNAVGASGFWTSGFLAKINGTYTVTSSIIQDDGGSHVAIGYLTNPALYMLDVNGTGKFVGQLTLGSTITNGTYTYTLPSATGTLALTSALSGYLPLTGGTLTGALGGTSATFSSSVKSNSNIDVWKNGSNSFAVGSYFSLLNNAGTDGMLWQLNASNNIDYWGITSNTATASPVITFTRAGAATFSSSVTTGGDLRVPTSSKIFFESGAGTGNSLYREPSNGNTVLSSPVDFNFTTSAGSALMTIKSGGNVGIGTTSPVYRLHIVPNVADYGIVLENLNANAYGAYFRGGKADGTTSALDVVNVAGTGLLSVRGSGDVYVGSSTVTTANVSFYLEKTSGAFTQVFPYTSGTKTIQEYYRQSGSSIGSITYNGTITSYNSTSDYRLKEDLKDYNALNIISKLKTYDFKWKEAGVRDYGMMAHELQELLPSYVSGEKDAVDKDGNIKPQSVDYSKLVPILIKGMQEQQAQIKELQTEIQTLKNK
jgi:hypothetical protein